MRRIAALLIAGALAAPSIGHADAGDCTSPCTIEVVAFTYVSPVAQIDSGTVVRWTTDTESHPTADTYDPDTQCFNVPVGAGAPVTPVRFDVVAGTVYATTAPGTAAESTLPCSSAVAVAPQAYVVHFGCLLHLFMQGALRVHE